MCVTVDDKCGRAASALGHHVAGNACVICRIGQTSLLDDEVMVNGHQEVGIQSQVDSILVLQPVHLRETLQERHAHKRTQNRPNKTRTQTHKQKPTQDSK